MACECHGEPMYWHKSTRKGGGSWRCGVRKREVEAAGRDRCREERRARQLTYWHRSGGGYVKRRRRHLSAQRNAILEQLDQLAQEAASAES